MKLRLPVLSPSGSNIVPANAVEFARHFRGELRFSRHDRMLYATDASIYQQEPLAVVVPADESDVVATVKHCLQHYIPVLPRGGGTSLAGQAVNRAFVLDLSPGFRQVLNIDAGERICTVEPGVSIDELNRQLKPTNLFFAPDPATVAQATIGGCIGNNAAGARSIKYGRTSENLAGVDVLLSTGERCRLEPGAGQRDPIALRLATQVAGVVNRYRELIRAKFPKTLRRNAGYGLDLICAQLDRGIPASDLDLSGLLCGAEGTLGIVLSADLKLQPIPQAVGLALLSYPTVEAAIADVPGIVKTEASAVELLDEVVLEAAGKNSDCRSALRLIPPLHDASPKAVLYVEYQAETHAGELASRFNKLQSLIGDTPMVELKNPSEIAEAWSLRKSAEALLHALGGKRKPQTFVEDNAIPLDRLAEFVTGFKQIVAGRGTEAAYYAHASVGVLHVRPMLDLHDPADRQRMQEMATEVADLAQRCGGVMSGEHGDGRARGPLLSRFFGPELVSAFGEIKRIFDPAGLLNPNMIVDAGSIESITSSLRGAADNAGDGRGGEAYGTSTFFEYSDAGGENFRGAIERCNGAGFCRKTTGGTMCPSYRATLDERHSPRGRANALRLALSGELSDGGSAAPWDDSGVIKTLDLCLSCKACKGECPSNVDIARLKAEYTAQRYKRKGTPLSARAFAHIRTLNRLGSIFPKMSTMLLRQRFVKTLLRTFLNIHPQRDLPAFSVGLQQLLPRQKAREAVPSNRPRVALFADCFTAYNDSHIGLAAARVLSAFGYQVELLDAGCCGRSMISNGLLTEATATINRTVRTMKDAIEDDGVRAIIVCEPSCLSAIKDDWLHLKLNSPMELRTKLAEKAFGPEEFLESHWSSHPIHPDFRSDGLPILAHGHCHQKALWGETLMGSILRRAFGNRVTVLSTGCCGMAGAFGYECGKYELSQKIGELSLFPKIREFPQALIVAPGTSCRHQINDGLGRKAWHPVEVLDASIGDFD